MFSPYPRLIFFMVLIIYQRIQENKAEIIFDRNPATVNENEPIGTVVATANDDIEMSGLHTYSLSPPFVGFSINTGTGLITTTKVFNFEAEIQKDHYLDVVVRQGIYSNKMSLQVSIRNVNEPPVCEVPKFVAGTESVDIAENITNGTFIYSVHADDVDVGDSLTYKIESKDTFPTDCGNVFSIDQTSGVVFITSTLDYDAGYHKCRLAIQVEDQQNLFCRGVLTINVQDLNDEPPVFKKFLTDTVHISESEAVGTIIAKVEAPDRDNDIVTYNFAKPEDTFDLDENSGDIKLVKPLDYDNPDLRKVYLLPILASDKDLKHITTYTLTVSVDNVDEAPICDPAFTQGAGASTTIPEDFPASETVYRIIAKDPDPNGAIKFAVISDQNEATKYFQLDTNSGIIARTNQSLDYDNGMKQYKIIISATEVGKVPPKSCTGTISINIQNVNDESPIYINAPGVVNVLDNQAAGTIIAKFTATDRDVDDKIFYEFASNHYGFSLDEETGELRLAYPSDYEDTNFPRAQILEIRAYDTGRVHSVTTVVAINIIDINDNPPQCLPTLYNVVLAETDPPDTIVASLNCWDDDLRTPNNLLTYTMALDTFSINRFVSQNNEILVGPKGLDYDNLTFEGLQFKHTILIKISDDGTPSLTSTVTLIVQVTRKNEWNPKSLDDTFTVPENSPIGTIVGFVKFTDADLPFDNVKYSIVGGNNDIPSKFYMEPNSGQLKVLNLLDAEIIDRYSLTVQAIDLNNDIQSDPLKQKTSFTTVTVNILNVNDEPPICNPAYYETTIYSTIKTPFLQLHCSDKDSASNQLSYVIVGGNTNNRFVLQRKNFNPPSVATTQSFQFDILKDAQDPKVYQLLVQVTDELGGIKTRQLTATVTVVIHVIPWTTTQPTTITPTTPFTTAVLIWTSTYWNPEGWFVALLGITGVSALGVLYGLAWVLFKNHPKCAQFFPKCTKPEKSHLIAVTKAGQNQPSNSPPISKEPKSKANSTLLPGNSVTPLDQFDGHAVDLVSGKSYLFNSQTGQRRWVN